MFKWNGKHWLVVSDYLSRHSFLLKAISLGVPTVIALIKETSAIEELWLKSSLGTACQSKVESTAFVAPLGFDHTTSSPLKQVYRMLCPDSQGHTDQGKTSLY